MVLADSRPANEVESGDMPPYCPSRKHGRTVGTPMKVNGTAYRTIWLAQDGWSVEIIDQTRLPHDFAVVRLTGLEETAHAISAMLVRGAPLIGATAAYGVALALRAASLNAGASDAALDRACDVLIATRPTAVNLRWALERMRRHLHAVPEG